MAATGSNIGAALVSEENRARWTRMHGQTAAQWIDGLPERLQRYSVLWGFQAREAMLGGAVSVVAAGERSGDAVVCKLAPPWSRWSEPEAAVLRFWNGGPAPRLLAEDDGGRTLLLERILPGTRANGLAPAEVAGLLRRLDGEGNGSRPTALPALGEMATVRFDRAREDRSGLLGSRRLASARRLGLELCERDDGRPVVVHGDFLAKNLLCSAARGVVVIDPNPALGEAAYDAAMWCVTERPIDRALERCRQLADELALDHERVLAWVYALGAGEVALAARDRAAETLAFLERHGPAWCRPVAARSPGG
ncbi:MAG TPA: aminoglycoside phosphotransferase family protein [Solirubrobacteraceae bacterium]|jgi:streptomycin 6-kinase|nr:aminoglycoside phosphotransferase family protein [Solirubrobacteraceae bacterium]